MGWHVDFSIFQFHQIGLEILFRDVVDKRRANMDYAIRRNAHQMIIVGSMKEHIHAQAIAWVCAQLSIFSPPYYMTSFQ